ncbi:type IV pilus assembly protein PilM [Microbacterium azadirachtae]|uniref:Type IV pilus assembly protein PilM n=1 Tax=Microbacterium azadirachtae TaxID=582680 RepID=A0A1I6I1K7_9MICO|nr:pilus assembly protein PilM [Microbacterium azadirachtae]SFR60616.1 type IV pilus assembly protein PilM [Microbacterium azadirachtae]
MAKSHVGVEITEESVRAVEVSGERQPQVVACGEVPLPPDAAHDSEVLDQGAVAFAIQQLWRTAGIKAKSATLGIASRRVLVREHSTAAMAPDLLRQALPFQVQDLLPVPVAQAVLDYYPTSQEGGQLHGLLVAAVADSVEAMIASFARAKIRIDGVDLAAFGLARAAARVVPAGVVAAINIGDHTTQIVILRDGIPDFVRITPVDLETSAVRRRAAQMVAPSGAGDGTFAVAGPDTGSSDDDLTGTAGIVARGALRVDAGVRPVHDLIGRMRSTLAFYLNRPEAAPIQQVLLSGAGSAVDGVASGLAAAVEVPVHTLSLQNVLPVRGTEPSGELVLDLVPTAGLALGKDR